METSGINDLISLDILKVCDGAFVQAFDLHFRELILNGIDPQTSHKAHRSMFLTATFYPDDDRQNVKITLKDRRSTAGKKPKTFHANIGTQGDQVKIAENNSIQTDEPIQLHEESGYDSVTSWVQLSNLGQGALLAQWYDALIQVAHNIQDVNCAATATRSIKIKVWFTLSDDKTSRSMGMGKFEVTTHLVSPPPTPFNLTLSYLGDSVGVREHNFTQTTLNV